MVAMGLFELAMLRNDKCVYDTCITNDVLGWLETEGRIVVLEKVARYLI